MKRKTLFIAAGLLAAAVILLVLVATQERGPETRQSDGWKLIVTPSAGGSPPGR